MADRTREILAKAPEVQTAYSNIQVGSANIYHDAEEEPADDLCRIRTQLGRSGLNQIADARVTFQSQNNGGPGSSGRDITHHIGW